MAFILKSLAVLTAVLPMASMAQAQETIEGIGPTTATFKVVTGFEFAEGPASDRDGNLYFTDFPKNRIYRFSHSGKLSVFADHSGQANGLMINGAGELVACQMDGRVVAYSLQDRKTTRVVAAQYNKHAFNAPNDLVIDAVGGVYFTESIRRVATRRAGIQFSREVAGDHHRPRAGVQRDVWRKGTKHFVYRSRELRLCSPNGD